MIIEEKQEIAASLEKVWQGLNNPETLRSCLPGCEEFELLEANKFLVVMQAKIGPVKAKFKGEIELDDIRVQERGKLDDDLLQIPAFLRRQAN